jgi:hypothetical protein
VEPEGVGVDQLFGVVVTCSAGALRSARTRGLQCGDQPANRPCGDDRRTGLEIRQRGVDGVDDTHEVDVEGIGEGLNRQMSAQRTDAGVGDDDVESAEFGDSVGKFAADRRTVSHVDFDGIGLAAGLFHLEARFFEITRCRQRVLVGLDVVTDVEEDDVSTLLGQPDGVATPLTTGTASDQNDFVLNSTHDVSF